MKLHRWITTALVVFAAGVRVCAAQDDPFEKIKSYDFQSRTPVAAIRMMIQASINDPAKLAEIEQKLVVVLDDPNATFAAKQEVCRLLWPIGTAKSVPSLAKLLEDEKTADIARYALERNVDPAAAKALRVALTQAKGKAQIGIINSIGDRGDAEAVGALKPLAADSDAELSEAAITALGKIGTPGSIAVLKALPTKSPLVYQAMLRTADKFAMTGKRSDAEAIYLSLSGEGKPGVVRASALRGLAALPSKRTSGLVLASLKSDDSITQNAAASVGARIATAGDVKEYTTLWPTFAPPVQVVLLTGFADHGMTAAAPLALKALDSTDGDLRKAGIRAAAKLGGASAVERLADIATNSADNGDRQTARESLTNMTGKEADVSILKIAQSGQPNVRATLMAVLADRPTPAAKAALLEAGRGSDPKIAAESLKALSKSGGATEYPELVKILVATQNDDVREAAQGAVVGVAQRLGNRDMTAAPVLHALPNAPVPTRVALIGVLSEIGGDKALGEITKATMATEPEVKSAAVSGLADTWSESNAVPALLGIAKSDANKATRIQALRGALRLIGQDDRAPAEERVSRVRDAMTLAERPEEKRQALSTLRDCRTVSAVELAAQSLDNPDLFDDAANTIIYLAEKHRKNNADQPAVTGPATTASLDKIILLAKDDNLKAQAQKAR